MNTFFVRAWETDSFLSEQALKTQIVFVHHRSYQAWKTEIPSVIQAVEMEKAERFFQTKDRELYLLTRYALRKILACITGMPPQALTFSVTANKKPFFQGQEFNITHAGDHIYLAFSPLPVGIDTEKVNLDFDILPIANICFSEAEKAELTQEEPHRHFYKIWTRKEAVLKATGEGLCNDIKSVKVLDNQIARNGKDYFISTRWHNDYPVSYATLHPIADEVLWDLNG